MINTFLFLSVVFIGDWVTPVPHLRSPIKPFLVAIDAEGTTYIARLFESDVYRIGFDGKPLTPLGRRGQGPGEFTSPLEVTSRQNDIWVFDMMRRSLSRFEKGHFVETVSGPLTLFRFTPSIGGWIGTTNENKSKLLRIWKDFEQEGTTLLEGPPSRLSPDRTRPSMKSTISRDGRTLYAHTPAEEPEVVIIDLASMARNTVPLKRTEFPVPDGYSDREKKIWTRATGLETDPDSSKIFPQVKFIHRGPQNTALIYTARSYVNPSLPPRVLDQGGTVLTPPYLEAIEQVIDIRDGWAWVAFCDGEDSFIARLPEEDILEFSKTHSNECD